MVDALRSVFMIYFLKLAVGADLFALFSFCCANKFAPTAFNCNYFNGSGAGCVTPVRTNRRYIHHP